MVNYRFKTLGLCLVIFLHIRKSSSLNATEKSPSDSFVVSANYGVQSDNTKRNSAQSNDNSESYFSKSYQPYEGYVAQSLFVNNNYHDYSKSYLTPSQEQNVGDLENTKQTSHQNEIQSAPNPGAWQAFIAKPCSKSNSETYVSQSYYDSYGAHSESTTAVQPFPSENYLKRALNQDKIVEPSQATPFDPYSPTFGHDVQNGYPGLNPNVGNVVYGSSNNENQETLWSSPNRKISNDKTDETQNNWSNGYQGNNNLNDFHKPNVVELQEMINKIVKGTSKVHQVLKVPAVYEIHLQEDEKPSGLATIGQNNNSFRVPLPRWPSQAWQPHSQMSSPQQWRKKRPPSKPRPTKKHQLSPEGHPLTKTWNLPSKIQYFNNRDGLHEGPSSSFRKYTYPKPFSSTGNAKEIPLKQSYNSKGVYNRNFGRTGVPGYGSVNVPMTPGSTEVTFLDYSGNLGHQNKFAATVLSSPGDMPDLSNYYAKKKEVENGNKNAYRRDGGEAPRRNYRTKLGKREERNFFPLSNLNYIFYVREKSRG